MVLGCRRPVGLAGAGRLERRAQIPRTLPRPPRVLTSLSNLLTSIAKVDDQLFWSCLCNIDDQHGEWVPVELVG